MLTATKFALSAAQGLAVSKQQQQARKPAVLHLRTQLHNNAAQFHRPLARAARSSPWRGTVRTEATAANPKHKCALLFDCDGVIVETEELHRQAYNGAFEAFDLKVDGEPVNWSPDYYEVLANTVGGGKPKMKYHFNTTMEGKWPDDYPHDDADKDALVDGLQDKKTEVYKRIVEEVAEARPGVLALMDEALARDDIAVGICSAATLAGFEKVVNAVVGPERLAKFDVILAGDQVERKKPDPQIYNMAREKLGISASKCVVIEDSIVGLNAALAAGMKCIITPTPSTANGDFVEKGATAMLENLNPAGGKQVEVDDIFGEDGLLDGNCHVDRTLPLCS